MVRSPSSNWAGDRVVIVGHQVIVQCLRYLIEGLDTLLRSARHISLRLHPDDHALVAAGAADDLAARGARLIGDVSVTRGGCVIESDLGVIDASIEARWHRAAAALGQEQAWDSAGVASE